jgi:hypothetical protein
VSLATALEAAAGALPAEADAIRPANGDAARLLGALSAESAARVAAWLIAERPDDAGELAELWSEDPKGQAALLAVPEDALPKEGRKLLRRVRHRLRSRGVATPEPAPPKLVARLPELDDALEGGFVTGLDPMGARQVWWLEPHPSGGARLFESVIDDARGVLAFEVYTPSRSELRRFVKSATTNAGFPAFAVDAASAKALVRRAAERQPGDHATPKRWIEWRARLGALEGARLPGELAEEALGGGAAGREALAAAVQLVAAGRVGPWPPLREAMTPVVERFRTALDSPLVVSGATRREQVARLVAEAAGESFAGAAGETAAHRFREAAFAFWRGGDEDAARACLAAAYAFAAGGAEDNPVAQAFVELWLRPLLEAAAGKPEDAAPPAEPSLLVRP